MDGAGEDYGDGRGDAAEGSSQLNVITTVGDLCVTQGWVPGRPLTEFGRGRPILPLPQERVKSRHAFEFERRFAKVSVGAADRRCYDQAMRA